MTFNYTFTEKQEPEPPTIQERFIEIYFETDFNLNSASRFELAKKTFTDQYHLKPPYQGHGSFKSMLTYRISKGNGKRV